MGQMEANMKRITLLPLAAVWACQSPADEYRAALPDKETLQVEVPAQQNQSLTRSALVGGPADLYSHTYYAARDVNLLGRLVVDLVTTIADYPPTAVELNRAVWGPFSEAREPNEFQLVVEKMEADPVYYIWAISGRPKSAEAFTTLAAGAFEPDELEDYGRGWFELDFEAIRTLDPSEGARGTIRYAFAKSERGVAVKAYFAGPEGHAAYQYGEKSEGEGYIMFAVPGNIHDEAELSAPENLLILTRWRPDGAGRADVVATEGDLEGKVYGVQCWDDRFVATFEAYTLDGEVLASDGDLAGCVLAEPQAADLPEEAELVSPYPLP